MELEISELERQNTWNITDLPNNRTALKGKQVYKIKTNLEGHIIKYKARWVVKGFNQILGLDYLDTFSSTCRPESYRIIFIIAMQNGWVLDQYDVKNAFIHASIDKEIYIELPIGFKNKYNSNNNYNSTNTNKRSKVNNISNNKKVCKLNKALYRLKQSPRLWYKHLLNALKELGFNTLPYNEAIFIHSKYKIIIICHVDDLIITGDNKDIVGFL